MYTAITIFNQSSCVHTHGWAPSVPNRVLIGITAAGGSGKMSPVPNGCTGGTLRNVWRKRARNFKNEVLRYKRGGESQTSLGVPAVRLNGWPDKQERFRDKFVDASLSLATRAWEDVRFIDKLIQEGNEWWDIPLFCLPSSSDFHTHTHLELSV